MLVAQIRTLLISGLVMTGLLILAYYIADRIWQAKRQQYATRVPGSAAVQEKEAAASTVAPSPAPTPPTALDPETLRRAVFLSREAQALEKSGRLEDAAQRYQEALRVWPSLVGAWTRLGRIYLQLHDYPKAARALERAVESDPSNPALLNDLGVAYLYQNRIPAAAEFFQSALDVDPQYAPALFNLVLCALASEDLQKAREHLESYLRLRPDDSRALKEKAYLLSREGHYSEALSLLKRALVHDPDWPALYFDAAAAAALLGDLGSALDYLRKAELITTPREIYRVYLQPAFQQIRLTELGQLFEHELAEKARTQASVEEKPSVQKSVLPLTSEATAQITGSRIRSTATATDLGPGEAGAHNHEKTGPNPDR